MRKIEIVFSEWDDEKKSYHITRKTSAEGGEADIAVLLVALGAEWERFLPVEEGEPTCMCGMMHDPDDPEMRAIQTKLDTVIMAKYGPEGKARLEDVIASNLDNGAEEFAQLVRLGQARAEFPAMIGFVLSRVRSSWLSEFPDFPEEMLDDALRLVSVRLKKMTGTR